jgi:hypothetical protein
MPILGDGTFSFTINSDELARGLRPSKRMPRNSKFLTTCEGAVGLDNVLQAIENLNNSRIDVTGIPGIVYPYPQLFVFTQVILLCTKNRIYELVGTSLVLRLDVTGYGKDTWSAADFHGYIFMSNSRITVQRSAEDGFWEVLCIDE